MSYEQSAKARSKGRPEGHIETANLNETLVKTKSCQVLAAHWRELTRCDLSRLVAWRSDCLLRADYVKEKASSAWLLPHEGSNQLCPWDHRALLRCQKNGTSRRGKRSKARSSVGSPHARQGPEQRLSWAASTQSSASYWCWSGSCPLHSLRGLQETRIILLRNGTGSTL